MIFIWTPLTWVLIGEDGCPVEYDSICNSDAREQIFLKKLPEIPNGGLVSLGFFSWTYDLFLSSEFGGTIRMGPYGKTGYLAVGSVFSVK